MTNHLLRSFFWGIICFANILYAETTEFEIQKMFKEAIEKSEAQLIHNIQSIHQKKLVSAEDQIAAQLYTQFLQEHLGTYWKNVEEFCQNAASMQHLPQANIWIKIKQLEEQIDQLQKEVNSLKNTSAISLEK